MNENQQYADAAILRTVELQSVATWLLADWIRQLDVLQKELIALIAQNDPTDGGDLDTLIAEVVDRIQAVFAELANRFDEAFDELAEIQAEEERNQMLLIFGITLGTFAALRANEIEVMGLKPAEWLKRTAGDLELRTTSAIRRGVTAGESLAGLIQRVKGTSELATEIATPLVKPAQTSLETLTRTAIEAVASQTRDKAAEAIPATVAKKTIRFAWRHKSVIDARTSSICLERANKLWNSDKKPIKHSLPFAKPPLHANCRSVLVMEILNDDPSKDETFAQFMARIADAEKRRVFGPKALKMWDAKKIVDSDLIRSREKQLSLDALRKRTE